MKTRPGLFVTVLAVVFLLLDGILLAWVGLAFAHMWLLSLGVAFLLVAAGVVVYYRKYLSYISDLRNAQVALRAEMDGLLASARNSAALNRESAAPPES